MRLQDRMINTKLEKKSRIKGKKNIFRTYFDKCGSCSRKTKMYSTCLTCMEKITIKNREKSKNISYLNRKCIGCNNVKPNIYFNYYFLHCDTRDQFKHKHKCRKICNDCVVQEFERSCKYVQNDSDYEDFESWGKMGNPLIVDEGNRRENIILSVAGIEY